MGTSCTIQGTEKKEGRSPLVLSLPPSPALAQANIIPTGEVSTLAGNGTTGFMDGNPKTAMFDYPRGLVIHPISGDLYVADQRNHRIRKITKGKVVLFFVTDVVIDCVIDVVLILLALLLTLLILLTLLLTLLLPLLLTLLLT